MNVLHLFQKRNKALKKKRERARDKEKAYKRDLGTFSQPIPDKK